MLTAAEMEEGLLLLRKKVETGGSYARSGDIHVWADCPPAGTLFAKVSQWGARHLNYLWAHQYISPLPPQTGAMAA